MDYVLFVFLSGIKILQSHLRHHLSHEAMGFYTQKGQRKHLALLSLLLCQSHTIKLFFSSQIKRILTTAKQCTYFEWIYFRNTKCLHCKQLWSTKGDTTLQTRNYTNFEWIYFRNQPDAYCPHCKRLWSTGTIDKTLQKQ